MSGQVAETRFGVVRNAMWRHRDLLLVTGAGLAVRVVWLAIAQPMPISDWHIFKQLAFDILDHGQLGYPERTTFYLPGQPVFLAIWAVVSRSDTWLSLGTILLSTASIPMVFVAGLRILHRRTAALIAAGLFALLPLFVFFSPVLATEHLFVFLMLSAMVLLLRQRGDVRMGPAAAAGAVLGLAMLTRGEGVFYAPALILFIWLGSNARSRRGATIATGVFVLAAALVVAPWYLRNAAVGDPETGLSSGAGINFYFAHNDTGLYGWYPDNQPFEGLSNDDANALGWRLAFEYLAAEPTQIFGDARFGTQELFRDPEYAIFWSTRYVDGDGDRNDPARFEQRDLFGLRSFESALRISSTIVIVLSASALLVYRRWSREMWSLVLPLIASTWFLRTVVYWAKPRYRYFLDVMLLFLVALVVWLLVGENRLSKDNTPTADARM